MTQPLMPKKLKWNGSMIRPSRTNTKKRTLQIGRCPTCYWMSVENDSRKNEVTEPKQKQHPVVNVTGDGSKVQCCKEQHCIWTWNVRSMNQGKLEVVKQEMTRVNVDILGISELKWTGMGEFNSDDHYIYYSRQESLRKKWSSHHSQQKSPKCSSWMQSQKWQNDLCSFPRQTIQYHSNPSLCPNQ